MIKNEQLMRLVCRTAALTKRSETDGTPHVKKRGHGHILSALFESEGMSQQSLADRVGIRPQSLSEALLSLEELGYIERRACEGDKRKTLVYITESGKEHSKALAKERSLRADKIFGTLDEAEKEQLFNLLSKLIEENNVSE